MDERPNYYAVIPAEIRYDKKLKDKAKLLYGEIVALSNKEGYCYASNSYFAELYGVSITTISTLIKNLIDRGYISSEIIYREGTKEILNRYLKILKEGYLKNLKEGIKENLKDNNTSINNTSNNNKRENREKAFTPPSLEEVEEYIQEKKLNVNSKKFIDYFTATNWVDSKGNKVKSWKGKLITWDGHSTTPKDQTTTNPFVQILMEQGGTS